MQALYDMAHDKNVRVHRVTQYFRGRPANKGAGKEDKMHGKGRWQQRRAKGKEGWTGSLVGLCKRDPASVRVVSQVAIADRSVPHATLARTERASRSRYNTSVQRCDVVMAV